MANLLSYKQKPRAAKLCIYGNPKTGKTELIGELAKTHKLLWIDTDNGIGTLFNSPHLGLTDEHLANIEYIRIPDTTANPVAIDTLVQMLTSSRAGYICDEHGAWNCVRCMKDKANFFSIDLATLTPENNWIVIIDNGSVVSDSAEAKVLKNSNLDPASLAKAGEDKATYGVYMGQGAMLHKVLSEIKNRNIHVVMTAHEIEASSDDKVKRLFPAIGTRNFASRVSGYFTNVIHTKVQNKKFIVESANLSSNVADCGGQLNLDISTTGSASITDYFKPPSEVSSMATVATSPIGKSKLAGKR